MALRDHRLSVQRQSKLYLQPMGSRSVLAAVVASLVLAIAADLLPPFVPSGANFSDATQADYARNVWQSTRPWLALVAAIIPVIVYAVWRLVTIRRASVLVVSVFSIFIAGGVAMGRVDAYRQPPTPVNGKVTNFRDREISQCGFPSHHLIISDSELRAAENWVKPGVAVVLYLTPTGDAAFLGPSQDDWPCVTTGLGQ